MSTSNIVKWAIFSFADIPDSELTSFFEEFFMPNLQKVSDPLGIDYSPQPEMILQIDSTRKDTNEIYSRHAKRHPLVQVVFNILPDSKDSQLYEWTKISSKNVSWASQGLTQANVLSRFSRTKEPLDVSFNRIAGYLAKAIEKFSYKRFLADLHVTSNLAPQSVTDEEVVELFRSQKQPVDAKMAIINALNNGQSPPHNVMELAVNSRSENPRSRHSSNGSRAIGSGNHYRTGSAPEPIGLGPTLPVHSVNLRNFPQVLVRRLPIDTQREELMEVFADFNVIHITSVMRNRVPSGHYDPNWGHVYVTLADTDSVEEAIANNHQKLTKLGGQLVHISVDRVYSKDQQFSSRKYPAGHMNRPESPPLSHRGRSSSRYEDLRHSDRFQRASSVGRSLGRLAEEIPPRHFERSRSIGRDIPPEFGGYESHQSRRRDPPGRNSSYPEHFSTHKRVRSPSIHQRHGGYDNDFRPQSKYIRSEMASNSYRRERDYPPQPYCPPTGYYQESRRSPMPHYYMEPSRDYQFSSRSYPQNFEERRRPATSPAGPHQLRKSPLHRGGYDQRRM